MYDSKTAVEADADILHVLSSDKKMTLSFIIINYNLAKEIEDCLNSLLTKLDPAGPINYEVIIVDNNSPDGALPETEKKYTRQNIHYYYLDKNVGFGKGCNFGFSKSSGEYVCFLNPDTIIEEDIFNPILDLFARDKSVGIIGPRQQVRGSLFDFSAGFYPNLLFELFNLFGLGVFFEGFVVNIYKRFAKKGYIEVDWILGAAIFMRAELFRAIDGFDKDYFMFFEEVDLCKRVSDKGYRIIYYPTLKIHHIGSVSGKKDYSLYAIRTYSSKYIYITKHYRGFIRLMMKSLLFAQLFSQILIWTVLFPKNRVKSAQKIKGFIFLLKTKMKRLPD